MIEMCQDFWCKTIENEVALHVHVRAFIAQLIEYCTANAEAIFSNTAEAPKIFFQATLKLLKL